VELAASATQIDRSRLQIEATLSVEMTADWVESGALDDNGCAADPAVSCQRLPPLSVNVTLLASVEEKREADRAR